MTDIRVKIYQTGHTNKHGMKKKTLTLSSRMTCMFKYECMKNPAITKGVYWEFKDNTFKWLVDFKKYSSKVKYKQQIKGVLDKDDVPLMLERMKTCKNPNDLYDKHYKAYTRLSFVEVLELTLEELHKEEK